MRILTQSDTVHVVPSGGALGADIEGARLNKGLSDNDLTLIEQAWADNLVLRFRDQQDITVDQLAQFSRNFGQLDKAPTASTRLGDNFEWQHPEITVISNVLSDGKPMGDLGAYEAVWHSDMTYNDLPPKGSALYAIEIPPVGGNTQFANMYHAYETLPEILKETIKSLKCVHDASRNSAGQLRKGYQDNSDPRQTVGAIHPLIRTHPVTGKKCLFLGRRRNAYIVGLGLADSEALLDELWAHATKEEFVWTQIWKLGDVILWDNRCTMHRRDSFDPNSRRLLYRTQITGEPVV